MKRNELFNLVEKIYGFFRFRESPKASVINDWLIDLAYIDSKAIQFISKALKELDTLPRNLPKIIKGIYAQYARQNKSSAYVKYDEYDDPRFPIEKLHRATDIFLKSGEDAFEYYCKTNYMPSQDIERCRNKVNCVVSKDKLAEMIDGASKSA